MNTAEKQIDQQGLYLSPFKVALLALNAACLGMCIVLWATGAGDGPLALLTIGSGLTLGGSLGTIVTQHGRRGIGTAPQEAIVAASSSHSNEAWP